MSVLSPLSLFSRGGSQFILGLMLFELVSILFSIVPDLYGNEYMTKDNKN